MSDQSTEKTIPAAPGSQQTEQKAQEESSSAPVETNGTTKSTAAAEHTVGKAPADSDAKGTTTESQPQPETKGSDDQQQGKETATKKESKPDYLQKNAGLNEFYEKLGSLLSASEYREMWGVPLKEDYKDIPTINVLIKFLRANDGDVKLAEEQLKNALQWRKKTDPIALLEGGHNAVKFDGLGYMTKYKEGDGKDLIVTWNIYGGAKNIDLTFGDFDE